jgi:hypothetical protein
MMGGAFLDNSHDGVTAGPMFLKRGPRVYIVILKSE